MRQVCRFIFSMRFSLLFFLSFALQAAVTVQVEPQQVAMGETIRLILTLNDSKTRAIPDLTPLKKQFSIIGTERSMSYTYINGQAQSTTRWLILMQPKSTGQLTIPALSIGSEKTDVLKVDVVDSRAPNQSRSAASKASNAQANDVMINAQVSTKKPYVNEQVIYTVKLFNRGQLMDSDYQPPSVENALMFALGEATRYTEEVNGVHYMVDEQRYAIYPQKSGDLVIKPATFNALTYDFAPRRIHLKTKPYVLNVQAKPETYKAPHWLPARKVELSQRFNSTSTTIQQGDTIERWVTIEAQGVPAQLLPNLDFPEQDSFNVYPEKPEEQNIIKKQTLVGRKIVKLTYVFHKPGTITLPEFKVTWFNTKTGQPQTARLPKQTFTVQAKESPIVKNSEQPSELKTNPSTVSKDTNKDLSRDEERAKTSVSNLLGWWVAGLLALAWLLFLLIWVKRASTCRRSPAIKKLQNACKKNDPYQARDALLEWAARIWPNVPIRNLYDVTKRVRDRALNLQIQRLSQALYGSDKKKAWHGADLWKSFARFKPNSKQRQSRTTTLPPINPE